MKKQVIFILGAIFCILFQCSPDLHAQADGVRIANHLKALTKTDGYRNYRNIPLLNQTAAYIFSVCSQYTSTTYYQPYQVDGATYKNVVCRLGNAADKPLVIVGAHYDVAGDQEGADDNASGVVGLLELVRLLAHEKLKYPVEIVAYSLEEPPFFKTKNMGSYIHAQSLHDAGTPVYGMVALEMIGYFDDKDGSQSYPVEAMQDAYGRAGNFIVLAGKTDAREFATKFSANFKKMATINTQSIKSAPAETEGIDYSDHLNYWAFGYDALMVTDTSFYRNRNYHRPTDTMETLDIPRMMQVIDATAAAIVHL